MGWAVYQHAMRNGSDPREPDHSLPLQKKTFRQLKDFPLKKLCSPLNKNCS